MEPDWTGFRLTVNTSERCERLGEGEGEGGEGEGGETGTCAGDSPAAGDGQRKRKRYTQITQPESEHSDGKIDHCYVYMLGTAAVCQVSRPRSFVYIYSVWYIDTLYLGLFDSA